jgi:hypothetical protein
VNRFREQVQRCAPHVLSLCPAADEPWFWDLVERFTAPGTRVTRLQAQKLLARHRIRRLSAEAILATLNEERLRIAPGADRGDPLPHPPSTASPAHSPRAEKGMR